MKRTDLVHSFFLWTLLENQYDGDLRIGQRQRFSRAYIRTDGSPDECRYIVQYAFSSNIWWQWDWRCINYQRYCEYASRRRTVPWLLGSLVAFRVCLLRHLHPRGNSWQSDNHHRSLPMQEGKVQPYILWQNAVTCHYNTGCCESPDMRSSGLFRGA